MRRKHMFVFLSKHTSKTLVKSDIGGMHTKCKQENVFWFLLSNVFHNTHRSNLIHFPKNIKSYKKSVHYIKQSSLRFTIFYFKQHLIQSIVNKLQIEKVGVPVMLYTCIQVTGWNIGQDASYPGKLFHDLSQSLQAMTGQLFD
jgi:hypothetical protein